MVSMVVSHTSLSTHAGLIRINIKIKLIANNSNYNYLSFVLLFIIYSNIYFKIHN